MTTVSDDFQKTYYTKNEVSTVQRRQFLGLAACGAGLAGCLDSTEPDEDLYFEEGSPFFMGLNADDEFSGTVRIVPSCRDETVEITITDGEPERSIPYTRRELGESCSFEIYVDDGHVMSVEIRGTEGIEIWIDKDGEIELGEIII